jgi:predicted cupin superfamily sugar epimerase
VCAISFLLRAKVLSKHHAASVFSLSHYHAGCLLVCMNAKEGRARNAAGKLIAMHSGSLSITLPMHSEMRQTNVVYDVRVMQELTAVIVVMHSLSRVCV